MCASANICSPVCVCVCECSCVLPNQTSLSE
jgi:hypothetical protein